MTKTRSNIQADDLEVGMYIAVLESGVSSFSPFCGEVENPYKCLILHIIAMDLPFVACRETPGERTIVLDLRDSYVFKQLDLKYAEAVIAGAAK